MYLVQGVPPHVAPGQGLIVGEDDGVILGVGLVAALADPAAVVRERVMEAPAMDRGPVTVSGRDLGNRTVVPPLGFSLARISRGRLALCSPTEGPGEPPHLGEFAPWPAAPTAVRHREWAQRAQGSRPCFSSPTWALGPAR